MRTPSAHPPRTKTKDMTNQEAPPKPNTPENQPGKGLDVATCSASADPWDKPERQACIRRLNNEIAEAARTRTTVGEALEHRRLSYCLRRNEFAKLLAVSKSHYSDIVAGRRDLPRHAVIRALAIGVPLRSFLAEYGKQNAGALAATPAPKDSDS